MAFLKSILVIAFICGLMIHVAKLQQVVHLDGKSLTEIPDTISKDVAILYVKHNRISKLDALPSRPIKELYLTHNSLSEFPNLQNVSKTLIRLELGHNDIISVDPDRLNLLTNLEILNLDRNPLSTFPDAPNISNLIGLSLYGCDFREFPSLQYLSVKLESFKISSNTITRIKMEDFEFMKNLKTLSLQQNKVVNLTLPDFNFLETLHLGTNLLAEFPDVRNIRTLKTLTLSYNKLSNIPHEIFANLNNLEVFDISGNNVGLTDIPDVVGPNETLQVLIMNNNPSKIIPRWENLNQALKILHIENTGITSLTDEDLRQFQQLDTLYAGYNDLSAFPFLPRTGQHLKYLYLQETKINTLTSELLQPLQNSSEIICEKCKLDLLPNYCFKESELAPSFKLNLKNAKLHCDLKLLWALTAATLFPGFEIDYDGSTCGSPTFLEGREISKVSDNEFGKQSEGSLVQREYVPIFEPFNCNFTKVSLLKVISALTCGVECSMKGSCLMFGFSPDEGHDLSSPGTCMLTSITGDDSVLPDIKFHWFVAVSE